MYINCKCYYICYCTLKIHIITFFIKCKHVSISQYPLTESTLSVRAPRRVKCLYNHSWLAGLSVSTSYRSSPSKVRFTTAVSVLRLSTHHAATSTLDTAFSLFSVAFDNLSIHIMTEVFSLKVKLITLLVTSETSPEALLECQALLATKPLMTAT